MLTMCLSKKDSTSFSYWIVPNILETILINRSPIVKDPKSRDLFVSRWNCAEQAQGRPNHFVPQNDWMTYETE